MGPIDRYADVVAALLETFFPALNTGLDCNGSKTPDEVELYSQMRGNHSPEITAEVRRFLPGPPMHSHAQGRLHHECLPLAQVLRTLRVLPSEAQRDLFL